MTKYRVQRDHTMVVDAIRFDPQERSWPGLARPWGEHEARPRGIDCWGYILMNETKVYLNVGDWVVTYPDQTIYVYNDEQFKSFFELCPSGEEETRKETLSEDRIREIVRKEIQRAISIRYRGGI